MVPINANFRNSGCWLRGLYYEICFTLNEQQLPVAWKSIWSHPSLEGPWSRPEDLTDEAALVQSAPNLEIYKSAYGLLRMVDGTRIACHTMVIPLSDDCVERDLCLILPVTLMRSLFTIHEPIHACRNPWREGVDRALIEVADDLFSKTRFDIAVLGEEAGAVCATAESVTITDLEQGGYLLSKQLRSKLGPGSQGEVLPSGLLWFPVPPTR